MTGGWNQHIRWTVGNGDGDDGSSTVTISSFADASVDIGLTAANQHDFASIDIDLGDIVNLAGFGNGPVSGTFAALATGSGTVAITNGHLHGSDTTALSIDVTASLPAEHATIHLHLTDSLNFTLTGAGYSGVSITQTAEFGGTVKSLLATRHGVGVGGRWKFRLGEIRHQRPQHQLSGGAIRRVRPRRIDPWRGQYALKGGCHGRSAGRQRANATLGVSRDYTPTLRL